METREGTERSERRREAREERGSGKMRGKRKEGNNQRLNNKVGGELRKRCTNCANNATKARYLIKAS